MFWHLYPGQGVGVSSSVFLLDLVLKINHRTTFNGVDTNINN
jgi:hypothetical protein